MSEEAKLIYSILVGGNVKTAYWTKAIFLLLSWFILFSGLESNIINSKIFYTSVLIYTGAVVYDLIFLCIETNARATKMTSGVFVGSLIWLVFNCVLTIAEFIGAMGGLSVVAVNDILMIQVVECGLTHVFPQILTWELKVAYFMIAVLIGGVLSVIPGVVHICCKESEQKNN